MKHLGLELNPEIFLGQGAIYQIITILHFDRADVIRIKTDQCEIIANKFAVLEESSRCDQAAAAVAAREVGLITDDVERPIAIQCDGSLDLRSIIRV